MYAVAGNHELGISVAVDYNGTSSVKPRITLAQPFPLNASIGPYVNITTESNQSFTAIVKFKYDNTTLSENITEKYLRMYWLDGEKWLILKNTSAGEDTNIDLNNQFVWARTSHFSTFTVADSSGVDSDADELTDSQEILGKNNIGPYYRWEETFNSRTIVDLQNDGWSIITTGNGVVEIVDDALHIQSFTGGTNNDELAYVETPEIFLPDDTKDYKVGFKVKIPQAGHQWFQVLNFGQVYLLLFSGGDDARLRYSTPTGELTISDLSLDTWHEIDCYVHPETSNYDVFIDRTYVKTCDFKGQNVRDKILLGDTWYPQNYGQVYWDYLTVWQGTDPLNGDSDVDRLNDDEEADGTGTIGPYYRWQETFDSCTVADLQNEGWTVSSSGVGLVEVIDGTLHINSITGGTNNDQLAYVETPEINVDGTKDYVVGFKVEIPQAGHQWFQVLNFGQIYLLLFSGGDDARLKYSTPAGEISIRDMSLDTWYEIECYAHPESENYDLFIDGEYVKTCDFKGQNVRNKILIGDTWYPQNYGQAYWDYIKVWQGTDPLNPDSEGDKLTDGDEILGVANVGPYYRWQETFDSCTAANLQNEGWTVGASGNGIVEVIDGTLHIQSITGSTNNDELAYVESPEIYLPDDTKDYKIAFKVNIPQAGHQWFQVLNFGQVYLLLFSGGDNARLKYSTPTGELTIRDLSLDTWYEIDCYVHPGSENYDVFIDGIYSKTCDFKGSNVRSKILLGDTWYPQNYGQAYWDYITVWQGTGPLNPDSDGDMVIDGKETLGDANNGAYLRWQETFDSCTVVDLQNEGWSLSSSGAGLVEVIDGSLHINSITGSTNNDQLAYAESPQIVVDGTKNYLVGFRVKIPQAGHQWFQVLNFGQVYLLLFSGGDDARLKCSTPTGEETISDLSLDTWYKIDCYAEPGSTTYDVFIDGIYSKTCDFKGQNVRSNILLGDTWYPQNYGQAYWDYIRIWQGIDALNPDSDGDYLNDNEEFTHMTNPLYTDTDGDGMWDGYEGDFGTTSGGWQNPTVYNNRFAILFVGGWNAQNNHARYWNQLVLMYDVLIDYNYDPANIFVFYADGNIPSATNIQSIGDPFGNVDANTLITHAGIIDFDGQETTFNDFVVDTLEPTVTDDDLIFFWVYNHGSDAHEPEASICCWNEDYIDDDELHNLLDDVTYSRMVFSLGCCYSGGFLDPGLLSAGSTTATGDVDGNDNLNDLPGDIVIMTSQDYRPSHSWSDRGFLFHFQLALDPISGNLMEGTATYTNGRFSGVSSDTDGNFFISMREAYLYAEANDDYTTANGANDDRPQYWESTAGLGASTYI